MSQHQQDRFAHGANRVNNCECPAVKAGVIDELISYSDHPVGRVIKQYDSLLFQRYDDANGVKSEDVVAEAWLEAMDTVSRKSLDREKALESAETVAEHFGWTEDN